MSKATSGKKVLIVNPATLTDRDGKSMRLIRFAQELKSMGNSVTIWAGKNLFSGVEFEVLAPSRNNKLLEYFGSDPYAPLTFELRNTFGMARNVAVPLIAEILSKAYQLVISSSVSPPLANLAALFACKIRGIPHVYDYDDLAPELTLMFKPSSIGELVRRIELTAESVIVRASNLVMTMSESMSAFLLRRTGRSSFAVYNTPSSRGLMNVPSKQESRRRHNLCQGEFIVGYIGNVQAEVRGLEHLIMVVPIAEAEEIPLRILVVGDGAGVGTLTNLTRHTNLEARVTFVGDTDFQSQLELLASCDITFCATPDGPLGEVMVPTKVFLSLFAGRPVIATGSLELRRILGEAGVFVGRPLNSQNLWIAIRQAYHMRSELSGVAEKLASDTTKRFAWEANASGFQAQMNRLFGDG